LPTTLPAHASALTQRDWHARGWGGAWQLKEQPSLAVTVSAVALPLVLLAAHLTGYGAHCLRLVCVADGADNRLSRGMLLAGAVVAAALAVGHLVRSLRLVPRVRLPSSVYAQ
jgi:hypothetical protein